MRLLHFAAGTLRAFKEHAVQNFARVDDDGVGHIERSALIVAGNELDRIDEFFG